MKDGNVIQLKSFAFAIRVVNLYRHLTEQNKEYVLSKQLLRSGTSVGANVEEGIGGQSKKDFGMKMTIAFKEARESHYWLRLLTATGYLNQPQSDSILADCDELLRLLGSITKTVHSKESYS